MPRPQFSIRTLFWLTLVPAIVWLIGLALLHLMGLSAREL
jgi:hypothetical protein